MSSTSFVKMHPLLAAAAASVIIVSMVGTAALMDWLPNSKGKEAATMNTATVPAAPGAAASVTPARTEAATDAATAPKVHATATHRKPANQATATQPATVPKHAQESADRQSVPAVGQTPAICDACGKVEGVRTVEVPVKPSGVGVVAGAVVGGLLGNQVGGGSGKTLATVAGAVGGGYAGNEIEKRSRKGNAWEVDVRMENGEKRAFRYETQPSWRAGDHVKVINGTLAAN